MRANLPHCQRQPRTHKSRTLPNAALPTALLPRRDHGRAPRTVLDSAQGILVTCINPKPGPRPGTTASAAGAWRIATRPRTASQPSRPQNERRIRVMYNHEYSARVTSGHCDPSRQGGRIYILGQFPDRTAPYRRAHPATWPFAQRVLTLLHA